jgi:hypothetical protein
MVPRHSSRPRAQAIATSLVLFAGCTSAVAQSDPVVMTRVIAPDPCPAWHSLMLVHYRAHAQLDRDIYELQKGCYDPVAPALMGPEPMTGLSLRNDFVSSRIWQKLDSGDFDHTRSSLTVGDHYTGAAGVSDSVVGLDLDLPSQRSVRHPWADDVTGRGIAFAMPLQETTLTGGTWIASWAQIGRGWNYESDVGTVTAYPIWVSRSFLFDLIDSRVSNIRPMPWTGDALTGFGFDLSVSGGVVTAGLSAVLTNPTDPATRVAGEWQTIEVTIPDVTGYLIGPATDPSLVAYGVGQEVFRGPTGVDIEETLLSIVAFPLPPGVTPEAILSGEYDSATDP